MQTSADNNSVGIIEPQLLEIKRPLKLKCGAELPSFRLVYETYGQLNQQKSNAILICHALSGHHHAAGYHSEADDKPGWWDDLIGPGKAVDTNKFFVVSLNNLGGCHGSTGPQSLDPATAKPYGASFPQLEVEDWVASQVMLSDHLGISCWAAVMGGSLGGMQALQWSISQPKRLKAALLIAAASQLHAQNIAFNEIARQAILSDPNFSKGDYLAHNAAPKRGLWLARMLGHITYLSEEAMLKKFGREKSNGDAASASSAGPEGAARNDAVGDGAAGIKFEVENYLNYQGKKFAESFDANTYLLMTRALDYFDPAAEFGGDLSRALAAAQCSYLVASFTTDWRFASKASRDMVDAIIRAGKPVCYADIQSNQGHDSFLMPIPRYVNIISKFLGNLAHKLNI